MARIIVKTNDGRHTLMDESVRLRQFDNQESAVDVLDRLTVAIQDADRRLKRRPAHFTPVRLPSQSRAARRAQLPYVRA